MNIKNLMNLNARFSTHIRIENLCRATMPIVKAFKSYSFRYIMLQIMSDMLHSFP
jgi:hypothetical protein